MSNTFGNRLRVTIFGQSHAPSIGVTMEGLPAGFAVDTEKLQEFMERRAPGRNRFSTTRKEAFLSICFSRNRSLVIFL